MAFGAKYLTGLWGPLAGNCIRRIMKVMSLDTLTEWKMILDFESQQNANQNQTCLPDLTGSTQQSSIPE